MKHTYPLLDLDDAGFRLLCAVKSFGAVHDAMVEGPFTAESYEEALYGVYDHLQEITGEVLDCIDACFEENRKETRKKMR